MCKKVFKKALKVALIVLVILLSGIVIAAVVVFNRPELMPPGPYHPRGLVSQFLGYRVHPWVKIDTAKHYTLKVWSTRWPIFRDGYGYDDLMEEAIEEFQNTYPNVDVEYVLLPLGEIEEAIEKAVENSTPPDICISPFDPSLVESGFVVPINMFISDKPREGIEATPATEFEFTSLKAASIGNRIWAWPSWITARAWAGNARILRDAGIDVEEVMLHGWTYEDVLTMVDTLSTRQAGVEEKYKTYGLILDTTGTHTIDTLMEAAGSGLVLSQDGSVMWQGEALRSGLSFLEKIRTAKGFPEPVHMMSDRMLELFWTGRAAVIGPVGFGFLRHVRERQDRLAGSSWSSGKEAPETVLLPVPYPTGGMSSLCITLQAAVVFSCPGASRVDIAYLAVRLAEALARKEASWLARELSVMPARTEDRQHEFIPGSVSDGACRRFLEQALLFGETCNNLSAAIKEKEKLLREQAIVPMMGEFWRGTIDSGEFNRRLSAFVDKMEDKEAFR